MLPPLQKLCDGYRDRVLDPVAVVAACLDRIARHDAAIRAVVALDPTAGVQATASAARWTAGAPLSRIDGAPVLVKANIAVAGLPWHGGIAAYADRIATADAACVARLRAAGAVILGLTNMDEAALGARGDNPWLGRTDNPRQTGFSAGGSSSGSAAAVAADFCAIALGTDTIGSIAIPAAYCGVIGHRATRATLALDGVMPLSPTLDHAGWLTRSVDDATLVADALVGERMRETPRLAALDLASVELAPAMHAALGRSLECLREEGQAITEVQPPVAIAGWSRTLFEIAEAEGAVVHADMLARHPDGFSPALRRMLAWGGSKGTAVRELHLADVAAAAQVWRTTLGGYDALLLPATPYPADRSHGPVIGDPALLTALPALLGWASTVVPVGETDGLPLAIMAVGRTDRACLAAARLISAG